MNERILELAKQAGLKFSSETAMSPVELKFAELIVREAARIARATPCPYEDEEVKQRLGHTWDMASLEAGRCIVEHFGVQP